MRRFARVVEFAVVVSLLSLLPGCAWVGMGPRSRGVLPDMVSLIGMDAAEAVDSLNPSGEIDRKDDFDGQDPRPVASISVPLSDIKSDGGRETNVSLWLDDEDTVIGAVIAPVSLPAEPREAMIALGASTVDVAWVSTHEETDAAGLAQHQGNWVEYLLFEGSDEGARAWVYLPFDTVVTSQDRHHYLGRIRREHLAHIRENLLGAAPEIASGLAETARRDMESLSFNYPNPDLELEEPIIAGTDEWYHKGRDAFVLLDEVLHDWVETGVAQLDPAGYWNTWPSGLTPEQKSALLLCNLLRVQSLPVLEEIEDVRGDFIALLTASIRLANTNDILFEQASAGAAEDYARSQEMRYGLMAEVTGQSRDTIARMERFVARWGAPLDWVVPAAGETELPATQEETEAPHGSMWVMVCAEETSREAALATAVRFTGEWIDSMADGVPTDETPFIVVEASHYEGLTGGPWVVLYAWGGRTEEAVAMESVGTRDVSCIDFYFAEVVKLCDCPGPEVP